jgi:hypothetical protein
MVHRRRRIPIALTALALAAAVSVPAAQAAPTRVADLGGVQQVAWAKPTAVNLDVAPTGDGPGDAEVCEAFETNISNQQGNFVDAVVDGDIGRAVGLVDAINNLADMANDAGCMVIW